MYITRPRSLYRTYPGALTGQPQPDAPYSGHLIVSDGESEVMGACCCGLWRNNRISRLPFPQDRILQIVHSSLHEEASLTKVWFLPVIDQPLSSNRYYIIKAKGARKGQAYTCSREGETGTCCFNTSRVDPKIRPFDYRDRYQQFEIHRHHTGGFFAKSVEWDGYPPNFLRKPGWEVHTSPSFKLHLREAQGLHNSSTLTDIPELKFTSLYSKRTTPILLGRWYCPFLFVKEEHFRSYDQMSKSLFYEFSLKQWWEQIYACVNENNENNENNANNVVALNSRVKRLVCLVNGMEVEKDGGHDASEFVWFRVKSGGMKSTNVGLGSVVFDKMKWVQESRGWFDGDKEVIVSGRKEIESGVEWRKFGCYVLVESLMLRRMDGTMLINFIYRNTQMIECKWE